MNHASKGRFDLAFNLEAAEQGDIVLVELQFANVVRHHLLHEFTGICVHFFVVDEYFTDIVAQVIAQGADKEVALLVYQE